MRVARPVAWMPRPGPAGLLVRQAAGRPSCWVTLNEPESAFKHGWTRASSVSASVGQPQPSVVMSPRWPACVVVHTGRATSPQCLARIPGVWHRFAPSSSRRGLCTARRTGSRISLSCSSMTSCGGVIRSRERRGLQEGAEHLRRPGPLLASPTGFEDKSQPEPSSQPVGQTRKGNSLPEEPDDGNRQE